MSMTPTDQLCSTLRLGYMASLHEDGTQAKGTGIKENELDESLSASSHSPNYVYQGLGLGLALCSPACVLNRVNCRAQH